jgi:hypothetical protein
MPELITALAAQHTPFLVAYRAVHQWYGIPVTEFAVHWNRFL